MMKRVMKCWVCECWQQLCRSGAWEGSVLSCETMFTTQRNTEGQIEKHDWLDLSLMWQLYQSALENKLHWNTLHSVLSTIIIFKRWKHWNKATFCLTVCCEGGKDNKKNSMLVCSEETFIHFHMFLLHKDCTNGLHYLCAIG